MLAREGGGGLSFFQRSPITATLDSGPVAGFAARAGDVRRCAGVAGRRPRKYHPGRGPAAAYDLIPCLRLGVALSPRSSTPAKSHRFPAPVAPAPAAPVARVAHMAHMARVAPPAALLDPSTGPLRLRGSGCLLG